MHRHLLATLTVVIAAPLPAAAQVPRTRVPTRPPAAALAHPIVARPKLGVALPILDSHKVTIGGAETSIYRPNLRVSLAWQGTGTNVVWRWQAADRAFTSVGDLAPPGLLASGDVSGESFSIDFGSFAPLGAPPKRLSRPPPAQPSGRAAAPTASTLRVASDVARTFYVRILPLQNGNVVGAPSNTVIVHFAPGPNPSDATGRAAIKGAAEAAKKAAAETEAQRVFTTTFVSFKPAVFPDPNLWGCVNLIKNPYIGQIGHPLAAYAPGKHCGAPWQGGKPPGFWDYAGGWLQAYDIMAGFYDDAKSWVADKLADALVFCNLVPNGAAQTCHDAGKELAGAAISAGLAAAGVPPTLPSVSGMTEIAKGRLVDGAVAYTCDAVKNQGGECTPEMEAALHKLYQDGVNTYQHELFKQATEPGCGNVQEAHANGVEPLPCFTDYPGVVVKPWPGTVYEPPVAVIRVTRAKPNPPSPLPGCRVRLAMWVHNHFNGGYLGGSNTAPADMYDRPYQDADAFIPLLKVGQSVDVTITMDKIRSVRVPGHYGSDPTPYMSDDWNTLYHGGKAEVSAGMISPDPHPNSQAVWSCGVGTQFNVQLQ
jgi:hypothetical protein